MNKIEALVAIVSISLHFCYAGNLTIIQQPSFIPSTRAIVNPTDRGIIERPSIYDLQILGRAMSMVVKFLSIFKDAAKIWVRERPRENNFTGLTKENNTESDLGNKRRIIWAVNLHQYDNGRTGDLKHRKINATRITVATQSWERMYVRNFPDNKDRVNRLQRDTVGEEKEKLLPLIFENNSSASDVKNNSATIPSIPVEIYNTVKGLSKAYLVFLACFGLALLTFLTYFVFTIFKSGNRMINVDEFGKEYQN